MIKPNSLISHHFIPLVACLFLSTPTTAQVAPSSTEVSQYSGIHAAAQRGNLPLLDALIKSGANLEKRDGNGRTALLVAVFESHDEVVKRLSEAGANMNALDRSAYDSVTIASVANDVEMVELALSLGASAENITSPYDGTALIAAAHLGHVDVVKQLIIRGAPLDHINNLGWTALIEAVILGDGKLNHIETVRALLSAGADISIADRQGKTALQHAHERGYSDIVKLLDS